MRFLVDNAVSPDVAAALARAGHDSVHIRERGSQDADDETIFAMAEKEGRVLVSGDTDFGTLLALRGARFPSLILFRHGASRNPRLQSQLILDHLEDLAAALDQGSLVVIEETRVRIRPLPLFRKK